MNVLVLNSGSSSLKFQLIATDLERIGKDADETLCRGDVERIGGEAIVTVQQGKGSKQMFTAALKDIRAALDFLVRRIAPEVWPMCTRSGIRVHGGETFVESALIDDKVLQGIEDWIDLAPLHNPNNIKGILAAREIFGTGVPQVAVFDTAFHHSLPEHALSPITCTGGTVFAGLAFTDRYRTLRKLTREQTHLVALHLGNGCLAAAIRGGRSVDTSMGMTPLEGLVMGTRSGDIDPAIVDLIATKEGLSVQEVDTLLNKQSGLLGISGLTNDMRALQEELREHDDRRVRLAIEIFCYRARKYIGAFLAGMGGADAVIFTGGIGENSAPVREAICEGLQWAGLRLDKRRNEKMVGLEGRITADDSALAAYVISTNEELLIARDTVRCIEGEPHPA